jgi:Asp-tRNA(Asn)/Glu-tRNA(Gln) amidotransferase A subunit family amidase
MALSWSMDHIGPICRTVEDCALVFNAIEGTDPLDETLYDVPFSYDPTIDYSKIRIGYLKSDFDSVKEGKEFNDSVFAEMRALGATLIPIELPKYPINDIAITLTAEAAAAFDDLTRSGKEDMLARQDNTGWPNIFRTARFIPAVEYIQANRIRYMVVQDEEKLFDKVDVYLAPSLEGDNLLVTNLTGNPCVVLPTGFTDKGLPVSITFIGNLFDEGRLLSVAKKYQDATTHHLKHPLLFR